jgi:hypothetical protein
MLVAFVLAVVVVVIPTAFVVPIVVIVVVSGGRAAFAPTHHQHPHKDRHRCKAVAHPARTGALGRTFHLFPIKKEV